MALNFLNSGYFAGSVGIGTETPTAPLDVFGVRAGRDWAINNRAVIRLDSNGAGYPSDILFGHTAAANQTSWTGVYWSLSSRGSSDAGKFHFYRGNGHDSPYSSEAVIMTFKPDLKVGIGTTNPAQNFVVADATNGNGVELVPGTTATIQTYNRGTSSYNNLNIDTASTRVRSFDYTSFHNGSGYGEKMRITSDGDLGINTTLPNFKLDVDGTFGVSDLPFNTNSVSVLVADETIASEIITNGSFDTDLTDWTNSSSYPWTSATWTSSGVSLQTSGSSQYKSFYQDIGPITLGKTYKISYSAVKTSGTMRVGVETSPVGSSVGYQKALTSSEVVSEVFTATTTDATCVISFWGQNDSSTNEWVIDNVSIKEVTSASNQIQKRELGTGAFGPTPVGAYLPLAGGTMTGALNLNDNVELRFGDDLDLRMEHDGGGGYIQNYTGNFTIRNYADDTSIIFQNDDGAGGIETYFQLEGASGGASPFTVFPDNSNLAFGSGHDLRLYHNGSVSYITNYTGTLDISNNADNADINFRNDDGAGGVSTYFYLDGSLTNGTTILGATRFPDNSKIYMGTGGDLEIYHDGSNSYIKDNGTGTLNLQGSTQVLIGGTNGEVGVQYVENAGVGLRHNNVTKLTTESTGINVEGEIKIDSALLDNQENTDVDTGTETVANVAIATYTAAFFDFVIKKTTNVRSGTVYACHDGTNVEFTETSTQDLGDTSDVTLSVDISGGNMRLQATTTSDDWSVKSLIRAI